MEIIKNFFLVLIPILLIETISQFIFLNIGEKRYSILFKPFISKIEKRIDVVEYDVDWNYETNKMTPGKFKHNNINYVINSKGFRGKEFNKKKDKIRILSFGGSTTIGLESPDDKTYPYLLENLLNKNEKKYEVINMGFGSKSLNFIKALYVNEALGYDPDFITIYSNRNSLMYDGGFSKKKVNVNLLKITSYLQENIMTYRLLLKLYNRMNNSLSSESKNLNSPFHKKGISKDYLINGYKNSLLEIVELSKKNGVQVILIKQAYFIKPDLQKKIDAFSITELIKLFEEKYFIKNNDISSEENFWLVLGAILNRNLDFFKKFENVVIVDPINNLLSNEKNFVDYLHLTPTGNFILAKEISKKF